MEARRRDDARHCRCCGSPLQGDVLDFGRLPVCNRFSSASGDSPRYPLALVICAFCGLIQLNAPPPPSAITPRAAWIRYNEPEAHLDSLVDRLLEVMTPRESVVVTAVGLGPFEEPLLQRLAAQGVVTKAPNLLTAVNADGGPNDACFPYLETWQAQLNSQTMTALAASIGSADIVSSRYLLEHCLSPISALRALRSLLKQDGILVLEVPDSSKFLAAHDYSFPWEEHVSYFVEETLTTLAEMAGYEVVNLLRYPGRLEDALVVVLRVGRMAGAGRGGDSPRLPEDQFSAYRAALPATRKFLRHRLADFAGQERDGVALFGLGHQAIMFINALDLTDLIGALADDDINKRGLFPPGLYTPIVTSADLTENDRVKICLLAVGPNSERKVLEKLAPLRARGVQFHSIYAGLMESILDGRQLWR